MKKILAFLLILILNLSLSACSFIAFSPEGDWDKSVTTGEFLSQIKTTEDDEFTVFEGDYSSFWQTSDEGENFLIIRSATGYMKIEQEDDGYSYYSVVNNEKQAGTFEECMERIQPDYRSYFGNYDETVLSLYDVAEFFKSIELNEENYLNYISFKKIEEEKEFTGYSAAYRQRVKPHIYMINSYVGEGELLSNYSEKISVKGTVSRQVTVRVYSLSNQLCSSNVDEEASGDNIEFDVSFSPLYIDNTESYGIHFTPYMDPLESWYLKTYSNGIQEVHQTLVEVSNIKIEEASGKLTIFTGIPQEYLSKAPDGASYVAVRLNDGRIRRIYLGEDCKNQLADLVWK